MSKVYSFHKSLKEGHTGEQRLLDFMPWLDRTDGRIADFTDKHGNTYELKTESRTIDQTPNLALEWESSPGKPGAIERAVNDNITYIIYLFSCGNLFVYRPKELREYMLLFKDKYRIVNVRNPSYITKVMLIPRDDLRRLECRNSIPVPT